MKKIYIIPEIQVEQAESVMPLATSGVTSNNGIGYGGVDQAGTLDPSTKENPFEFEYQW